MKTKTVNLSSGRAVVIRRPGVLGARRISAAWPTRAVRLVSRLRSVKDDEKRLGEIVEKLTDEDVEMLDNARYDQQIRTVCACAVDPRITERVEEIAESNGKPGVLHVDDLDATEFVELYSLIAAFNAEGEEQVSPLPETATPS